jgi:hypothetical protein
MIGVNDKQSVAGTFVPRPQFIVYRLSFIVLPILRDAPKPAARSATPNRA